MLRAIRLFVALALLLPSSARAGTAIVNQVGKDFGGYYDIGTQGNFGSDIKNTAGKAYSAWIKTHDTTVTPVTMTWFGVPAMPIQYGAWMINTYWTTDYAQNTGYALVFGCGANGNCWAYYLNLGASNFNDGAYHHHVVTWSGLTSGKPTAFTYYIDNVAYTTKTDVSDTGGLNGTASNFTKNILLGCDGKTDSMTPIDMSTFDIEDLRIYSVALTVDQVNRIYKAKGRDMLRTNLLSRYPFWHDGKNIGPNGVVATPHNNGGGSSNPTIETTKKLSGTHRKVM